MISRDRLKEIEHRTRVAGGELVKLFGNGSAYFAPAQSAIEKAVEYAGDREQFGKKIQDFQSIQFKLADMATELEASRLMLRDAANKVDGNAPDKTKAAAMAKRFVTDMSFKIVNEALQIHGGYGYLKDYPLERNLRDVRVHQILEGTNEIMNVIISREILKENR